MPPDTTSHQQPVTSTQPQPPHPAIEPEDLQLRHGYRIKPIGNRYIILNDQGVSELTRSSPSQAVSELLKLRGAWVRGYYAGSLKPAVKEVARA